MKYNLRLSIGWSISCENVSIFSIFSKVLEKNSKIFEKTEGRYENFWVIKPLHLCIWTQNKTFYSTCVSQWVKSENTNKAPRNSWNVRKFVSKWHESIKCVMRLIIRNGCFYKFRFFLDRFWIPNSVSDKHAHDYCHRFQQHYIKLSTNCLHAFVQKLLWHAKQDCVCRGRGVPGK